MKLAVVFLTALTCGSVRTWQSKDATYTKALPAHGLGWALPGKARPTEEVSVFYTSTPTTTTTTPEPEPEEVKVSIPIRGISMDQLNNNTELRTKMASGMQETIAKLAQVNKTWVTIGFRPGSTASLAAITRLETTDGIIVDANITIPPSQSSDAGSDAGGDAGSDAGSMSTVAFDAATIQENLNSAPLADNITTTIKETDGISQYVDVTALTVTEVIIEVVTTTKTTTPTDPPSNHEVSSFGDPHSKNIHGQRFDIQLPGNHSFIVLPRGADQGRANLYVEARVTRRGGLCTGKLFITGLKLAGQWMRMLGGDVDLYAATEMFNSPEVVGLKLGNSSNISLEEFRARIPKHNLEVSQSRPELPTKLNTHVNTLRLRFKVGPSTLKVGWAHEKLKDGFANWLWLGVSGLGTANEVGGLLGSDDHSAVQEVPKDTLAACQANPGTDEPAQDAGFVDKPKELGSWAFRSWASVES